MSFTPSLLSSLPTEGKFKGTQFHLYHGAILSMQFFCMSTCMCVFQFNLQSFHPSTNFPLSHERVQQKLEHNKWKFSCDSNTNPIPGLQSNKTYMSAEFSKIRSWAYQAIKCMCYIDQHGPLRAGLLAKLCRPRQGEERG